MVLYIFILIKLLKSTQLKDDHERNQDNPLSVNNSRELIIFPLGRTIDYKVFIRSEDREQCQLCYF